MGEVQNRGSGCQNPLLYKHFLRLQISNALVCGRGY